jgi:hypothetical protein
LIEIRPNVSGVLTVEESSGGSWPVAVIAQAHACSIAVSVTGVLRTIVRFPEIALGDDRGER